ncbi:CDP-alcohol phosphatidyltransferase family protein [Pseudorhodoferax sp.]|uniref:CDP-alcohol phosphatidyltransferase family protein n=1 Tax=Pseudorhodoferax sp. TaxID=1993553 RepID=UPI002DD67F64|nr:CDP-alcohol phosphatidyltransferase family protein [Pseudorhodoferax sp.]
MLSAQAPAPLLRRDAARALALGALALLAFAAAVTAAAGLGPWFVPKALALFGLGAACVWHGLAAHAPHARFGAANAVTLARLALVALLAAAAGEPLASAPGTAWAAVALATLAATLDAVDGPLARRSGQASAFGARFDMETDALLILVLSVLVLQFGKAGAWVLACGGMRYAFVLAARAWPWLDAPLPPSLRRKTVCVLQIVALIVCLAPAVPLPWSTAIAALGLLALACSFATDIAWLARLRRHPHEARP